MSESAEEKAFLDTLEKIRKLVEPLEGSDARLALSICLGESIVFGSNTDDDDSELRLAFAVRNLGTIVTDILTFDDGDDGRDDDEPPSPPLPPTGPLAKLLEGRRSMKAAKGRSSTKGKTKA
jgi:hypothetical protein